MPLIEKTSYPGPPRWQYNGHLQTLYPGIFRRVRGVRYQRERIETPDADFLDLDWLCTGNRRLLVLTHGLEGNSHSSYLIGMAKYAHAHGWDVLAWNCRSCSGEMNRAFRMYHHGDIEDIGTVVDHAVGTKRYDTLALAGYSMGGNITMKYLGVRGRNIPKEIVAGVAFSSPCDIAAGADVLDRWDNWIYRTKFQRALLAKLRVKAKAFPGRLDMSKAALLRRWRDFDEYFSAPICGFASAAEFHAQASAKNFIEGIRVPTLLVSAKNDPILTSACFPVDIAQKHAFFHLELTEEGGHCGFMSREGAAFWSEERALEFVEGVMRKGG
jgi:uncharacterized protein